MTQWNWGRSCIFYRYPAFNIFVSLYNKTGQKINVATGIIPISETGVTRWTAICFCHVVILSVVASVWSEGSDQIISAFAKMNVSRSSVTLVLGVKCGNQC
jgi:hypothetical protein